MIQKKELEYFFKTYSCFESTDPEHYIINSSNQLLSEEEILKWFKKANYRDPSKVFIKTLDKPFGISF